MSQHVLSWHARILSVYGHVWRREEAARKAGKWSEAKRLMHRTRYIISRTGTDWNDRMVVGEFGWRWSWWRGWFLIELIVDKNWLGKFSKKFRNKWEMLKIDEFLIKYGNFKKKIFLEENFFLIEKNWILFMKNKSIN